MGEVNRSSPKVLWVGPREVDSETLDHSTIRVVRSKGVFSSRLVSKVLIVAKFSVNTFYNFVQVYVTYFKLLPKISYQDPVCDVDRLSRR